MNMKKNYAAAPQRDKDEIQKLYNEQRNVHDTQDEQRRVHDARSKQQSWEQQGLCRHCGGQMGGFFTKKCKSCGKPQV